MALNLSKPFTFAPSTTIASSEVNSDFDTLYNAFTGLEAGTSSMSKLPLDTDPTSALYAATKQYVDAYANWKRPVLEFVSVSTVDVDDNTGTANQTKIVFPDGNYRSVTENTSVTSKYRRFDITATAEFTSGTEESGLRTSLSEAVNTWYAIYAVKSLINTANFVLVGDTTIPTQANYSALNGFYGTNGWVYLGMIRNGDNSGATVNILNFTQNGHTTLFTTETAGNTVAQTGIRLATTAGATSLAYTYAAGTGATDIPGHLTHAIYSGGVAAGSGTTQMLQNVGAARVYFAAPGTTRVVARMNMQSSEGLSISNGSSVTMDIFIAGYTDLTLGVGSNPLI